MRSPPPALLVSVRDPSECSAAIAGGASLIDVKEPRSGPMGMADPDVIAEVAAQVSGRLPVSVALGELVDWPVRPRIELVTGITFVKIGLAGCGGLPNWPELFDEFRAQVEMQSHARLVAVAYADWRRANAPSPEHVVEFAFGRQLAAFLIDTCVKDGRTLLDWTSAEQLGEICKRLGSRRIPLALAGSLGREQIHELRPVRPAWFAVRGAACNGGRDGTIDSERVRELVNEIALQPVIEEKP
jgi:uncharacterized protein (UPF0264 family)